MPETKNTKFKLDRIGQISIPVRDLERSILFTAMSWE